MREDVCCAVLCVYWRLFGTEARERNGKERKVGLRKIPLLFFWVVFNFFGYYFRLWTRVGRGEEMLIQGILDPSLCLCVVCVWILTNCRLLL